MNTPVSLLLAVVITICLAAVPARTDAQTSSRPFELRLSLREAMEAALDNNPNVKLFRERIETVRAASLTQFGTLLQNLSSTVHQSRQTLFLGTIGLAPIRTNLFSILDARASVFQSLFSMSLIQR